MLEFTYEELMELKYEARHGDEYSMRVLDEYYDQFEEIPSPMTFDEAIAYKQEQVHFDTLYWIMIFEDDYYGEDGRYDYPYCKF